MRPSFNLMENDWPRCLVSTTQDQIRVTTDQKPTTDACRCAMMKMKNHQMSFFSFPSPVCSSRYSSIVRFIAKKKRPIHSAVRSVKAIDRWPFVCGTVKSAVFLPERRRYKTGTSAPTDAVDSTTRHHVPASGKRILFAVNAAVSRADPLFHPSSGCWWPCCTCLATSKLIITKNITSRHSKVSEPTIPIERWSSCHSMKTGNKHVNSRGENYN